MHIGLRPTSPWLEYCEKATALLGVEPHKNQARLYQGLSQALIEAAMGLTRLFPHRKKILYFKNIDPAFEECMRFLAKEGFNVIELQSADLSSPEKIIALIDKETNFVLYAEDSPLLGQRYDCSALELALKEKNILKVKVRHNQYIFDTLKPVDKNTIELFYIEQNLCLGLHGERARFAPIFTEMLNWQGIAFDKINSLKTHKLDSKQKILGFEGRRAGDFSAFFKPNDSRVWDRAVIYWEDMDGTAFIELLAQERKINLPEVGGPTHFETTSLSRWGGVRYMDWLKNQNVPINVIRGLVVLSSEILDEDIDSQIVTIRNKILDLQSGQKT